MAVELKGTGVRALTLYPCAGVTEVAAFPGGETAAFCGRALAALVDGASEEDLDGLSGKVIHSVELAQKYGTIDPETNPAPTDGALLLPEAVAGVRARAEAGPNSTSSTPNSPMDADEQRRARGLLPGVQEGVSRRGGAGGVSRAESRGRRLAVVVRMILKKKPFCADEKASRTFCTLISSRPGVVRRFPPSSLVVRRRPLPHSPPRR